MAEQQLAPHAEAVSALVTERYGQLVGYARKRLRALDVPPAWVEAEDVVHNALAGVLARTEPIEKLRPYVFTVINNEASHAARRYRSGLGYGAADADVQLETGSFAADPWDAAGRRLDVQAALSALPPQQRTAVFCTKALQFTQAETARVMGAAPGTVATHVSRAVITLKIVLGALAVVLVGGAMPWLRSGAPSIDPAAGGDVLERLGSSPGALVMVSVIGVLLVWWVWKQLILRPARQVADRFRGWRFRREARLSLLPEDAGPVSIDADPVSMPWGVGGDDM
ncbi:sigma-70 family RNA polymerase sigma factor [Streptomyces olivaceoviridis]|uniref:sigma-70 family RNA polymerase sigma factor n=1 Tax=Streptomyces olivaceoviridis TaxID=1921 RepID=UPI0037B79F25